MRPHWLLGRTEAQFWVRTKAYNADSSSDIFSNPSPRRQCRAKEYKTFAAFPESRREIPAPCPYRSLIGHPRLKGSADLDLMKREFEPLVKSRKAALQKLEVAREDLPVISEFYRQMDEKGRIRIRPPLDILPWSYFKSLRDR